MYANYPKYSVRNILIDNLTSTLARLEWVVISLSFVIMF